MAENSPKYLTFKKILPSPISLRFKYIEHHWIRKKFIIIPVKSRLVLKFNFRFSSNCNWHWTLIYCSWKKRNFAFEFQFHIYCMIDTEKRVELLPYALGTSLYYTNCNSQNHKGKSNIGQWNSRKWHYFPQITRFCLPTFVAFTMLMIPNLIFANTCIKCVAYIEVYYLEKYAFFVFLLGLNLEIICIFAKQ